MITVKHISIFKGAFICITLLGLGACSSVTKGTSQDIFVDTKKVSEAKCTLHNDKGSWTLSSTPGTVNVRRGGGDLSVNCEKENYQNGQMIASQGFEPMTLGNILIGGVVGVVVDAASGAAFDYPPTVSVLLTPSDGYVPPEAVEEDSSDNYMANYQGFWTGYEGSGCFEINSWTVDITANASIEKNQLKLSLTHKDNARYDHGSNFNGMDTFTESRALEFGSGYNSVQRIKIQVDESSKRLFVTFDGKCRVYLKQTYKEVIAWNFEGKPAIKTPLELAEANQASVQIADFLEFSGNWTGYEARGCISFSGNPSDATVDATVVDNVFRMKLSHKHTFGSDQGMGLRAEDQFPANGQLAFDPNYDEVDRVYVTANKASDQIFVKFSGSCEITLKRTNRQTLSPDFKGKPALKADFAA